MEPEIEVWLEDALVDIKPSLSGVSRVSLEPDYESGLTPDFVPDVRADLLGLLARAKPNSDELKTHEGQVLELNAFPALRKYARKVSLHGGETPEDPWVDVTPAGNWI